MSAPPPGWNPDPTGRHEYRYWDGATWTDDVSDNGVTSVDPIAGPSSAWPAIGGTVPGQADATRQYAPQSYAPEPGSIPGGGYGAVPPGGTLPQARPGGSGPSTGLIVGLVAAAVALLAAVSFVVVSSDDGNDTATDDIASSSTTAAAGTSTETTAADTSTDGTSTDGVVELIAAGMEEEAAGAITHDQAMCAAQAIVDELGMDAVLDMSAEGGDAFTSATPEQQAAMVTAVTSCIPIEVLAEMGVAGEGGG